MPKLLAISLVLFAASGCGALAREEIAGPVTAEIKRVIDGDTLLVEARPWPQQRVEVYVRIRGIDAAELHSKCSDLRNIALDARQALEIMTAESPMIQLTHISGDKYFGRIVADILLPDGSSVGNNLLASGMARPYDGGRKPAEICSR
ncbi:endonuclease YncB(thermonuclease family) [Neorhizobium alkalisoli]|uniref:Endonuclease YncB(Thermonuclease family) n=1 Tax=Neorhizobium alkalisoli TaxID=528178 RepID=A0A561Q8B3_9HYPH|nr:endonuclease YncB(thermonuclease family) [Neorhizobium alkalisoli]